MARFTPSLTAQQRAEIVAQWRRGVGQARLASEFRVSLRTVSSVCNEPNLMPARPCLGCGKQFRPDHRLRRMCGRCG